MRYLLIQDKNGYMEYPIMDHYCVGEKEYIIKEEELYSGERMIPSDVWVKDGAERIFYLKAEQIFYEKKDKIFLSKGDGDIQIPGSHVKIYIGQDQLLVEKSEGTTLFLNQKKIGDGIYSLEEGAVLFIENCKIVVGADYLSVQGQNHQSNLCRMEKKKNQMEDFPHYKRSPRLVKRIETKKIKVESETPGHKGDKKGLAALILPPLCMMAVTVAISIVMKRGMFILMSVSATVMSTIFSVVKYLQDKKEDKEKNERMLEVYKTYLLRKRKEIYQQWKKEEEAYRYNYPQIGEIVDMVDNYSSRIYERSSMDDDFLTFSVGHAMGTPAFSIETQTKELNPVISEFQEEMKKIRKRFGQIDKPQIVDLKKANLGLVGEKSVIHEQMKYYISQLAFLQSYHDVQFLAIYSGEYQKEFAWMRWLSHARIQGLNVLGLIHTEKTRDQILGSLQQILKERKQRVEESKKEERFLPHYIFWIDEPKMIMDHSIMEFLGGNDWEQLGFSIIYTSHLQANLPENIGTVLLLENSEEGRLLLKEKELCDQHIHLYRIENANLEMMARNLGVLVHEQGITSHIPESITFFDLYGVRSPEELMVRQRWSRNNSSKTLAVPLGARGADDYLELNLHEKAHGPHGLVAGTTGSGKSEIVQSYILSLAVNFHPYEVGFLLIDYKGGGMANLFKNLPHLLGTITNLDGSESMRALASIQSELRRRQRVFGEHDVNHINAYNDLFKEGKAKEPIPHLFLISDEFAELKKEQPEFMKELVSTARIGRSLGVHLILATQKPTGVVDDQIWTNSKFKLCLKVQNEADSKEVLHTPDAANITQAGRAYLQVGNNEIYELFQSAWSGAMYIKETEREVTQDNRVYLVNELGQGELINQDLRGTTAERKAKETQLDVVVSYIHDLYEKEKTSEVKRPWLPSLPDKMVNPHPCTLGEEKVNLDVVIGMRDIPEEQAQEEYIVNLPSHGNIVYVASSGYGKSVFLANVALNLAAKNRVSNLNLYVLDFGNNALIALSRLPHMSAYIMLDDVEKFEKFRDLMQEEMKNRKKLMASVMAQNFSVYNETAQEPLKAIVILIDNYDAVKEMGFEMEEYFTKLTRDGTGLGIYVVITASRNNAVRLATLNNFKNKIAGYNFDENEVKSLVGRSQYALPEIRGRALVKQGEYASIMQIYTPTAFENEVEYNKNIQNYVEKIREVYPGEEAVHIPILPEELDYPGLFEYEGNEQEIALGLDKETVVRKGITKLNSPFLILGDNGSGKTNALKIILSQIPKGRKIYLFDSRSRGVYFYREKGIYVTITEELEDFANVINEETKKRQAILDAELAKGKEPQEVWIEMEDIYVVVDDIDDFCELAGTSLMIVAGRLRRAAMCGITFIVTANTNKFKGTDDFTKLVKATRSGLLLSGQGYLTIFPIKMNQAPEKPDGYLMVDGKGGIIRIPEME